jgi:hypothetical protein
MTGLVILLGLPLILFVSLSFLPPGRQAVTGLGVAVIVLAAMRFAVGLADPVALGLLLAIATAGALLAWRQTLGREAPRWMDGALTVGAGLGLIALLMAVLPALLAPA